jgi:hypothetical protein
MENLSLCWGNRSCGICVGQSGTGAGFLRVLRFPLPTFIPPIAPQSPSTIIRGSYNRPNSIRRTKWTQSHHTPRNLEKENRTMESDLNQIALDTGGTWILKKHQIRKDCRGGCTTWAPSVHAVSETAATVGRENAGNLSQWYHLLHTFFVVQHEILPAAWRSSHTA